VLRVLLLLVCSVLGSLCSVLGWWSLVPDACACGAQKPVADSSSPELHTDARVESHAPGQSGAAESTQTMAALLRQIYLRQDWKTNPNKPLARAEYYEGVLKQPLPPALEMRVREALAEEWLNVGESRRAVEQFEAVRALAASTHAALPPEIEKEQHSRMGLAYLRLGEQENCVHYHGQKSCIFPIRGSGVHHLTEGAEGAIREFSAALEQNGDDLDARWLLNIAYMQVGRYPQGVPGKWLVPESRFRSEYDIGSFNDVAPQAGLSVTGRAGGAVMEDFDGDGLLDVMVSSSGPQDQVRLFRNNGNGTFAERTREAGLTGETGGLNMICADYNNDGHPDVMVLRGGWWGAYGTYPLSLLKNNGDGSFSDVTVAAGLMSPHPTQTAAWADYDNDGWLDVYVAHESQPGDAHPSQLFHNNHDGTFTDVAAASGLAEMGFVKGVAWGDFNSDGRPDLYVSIKGKRNRLLRNDGAAGPSQPSNAGHEAANARPGQWRFTDVTEAAGVAEPVESFATWFFDYDNDGWPDLFVAGYSYGSSRDVAAFEMGKPSHAETPRLYHNNHDGTFTDVARQMRLDRAILIMGASFGDVDNDGWLDLYFGTGDSLYQTLLPNRMFRNDRGRGFQDVTTGGGFGHLQKGHSVAFGDINNDGQEDVFEEMGGALPGDTYASVLYENPGHSGSHWISLDLEGVAANRSAIGARIDLTVKSTAGRRHICRTVGYGSSFGGNPLRQHIGLGGAAMVDTIEVQWPASRLVQRFQNVAGERGYRLREGGKLEGVELKRFRFGLGLGSGFGAGMDPAVPMRMP
jgi:hypothetical protein